MPNIPELERHIRAHLTESARVKHALAADTVTITASAGAKDAATPARAIADAALLIASAFQSGGKLLLCGNGGSAADCQHMATEFTSRLTKDFDRPALPAIALTTDTSFLTAYANDLGFEDIFGRQIQALGKPGDVLLGISTSGSSANIIRAVEVARTAGLKTIALTGSGGKLGALADVAIAVPSTKTSHIQEAHLAIEHAICDAVERILFPDADRGTGNPATALV